MTYRTILIVMTLPLFPSVLGACAAAEPGDDAATEAESSLVSDAKSITARGDGSFDVVCQDGRTEIATTTQILASEICKPVSKEVNPFDPASCEGETITEDEARAFFAPAASKAHVGGFRWLMRTRACNTETGCAAWSEPSLHSQRDFFFVTRADTIHSYFAATDGRFESGCGAVTTTRGCGSYPAKLTNHCLRVTASDTSPVAANQSYAETEYAAVLNF